MGETATAHAGQAVCAIAERVIMPDHHEIPIDPRVKDFYGVAENYDEVDSSEINPSLFSLSKVSQRYESAELIAEGGMKQIYKVYDARARRYLAMALLRPDAPEDLFDPFIHEAWLTAQLAHPNIIAIHDIGVNLQRKPYFTMDLKAGDSLRELIEKLHHGDRAALTRYPLETLLQIFIKVCDAMSYAHSIHVLHLDLKPANIQVGDFGQVLVCDWGMGKVLGKEGDLEFDRQLLNPDLLSSVLLYGELKGTPGNMAPEQVLNEGELDVRTDVYGLGGILYALLTYLRPLSGSTEEILQKTKNGAIVSPCIRAPERNIPKALDAVVMKALAKDPDKRYASVTALRNEVHRYLTGYATEAENAGIWTQMNLFYRRNKRFCITVSCSALVGVAGALFSIFQLSAQRHLANEALLEAEQMLALYDAGQDKLEMLGSRYDESVKTIARRHQHAGNYTAAENVLRAALEEDPDNPVYLYEMGQYFFTMQRFNAALGYFDQSGVEDDVVEMARKYAPLKRDDGLLTPEQMADIFGHLILNGPLEQRMVLYDQRHRLNLRQRARIVKAYLHVLNPEWTDAVFEYDPEKGSLKLGGTGLHKVSPAPSVL
ncbi:MAG: serine/threonine protein kinase, partial [Pontiella sp.]|nr:serine/threonine protein kinase [Pontiella sp.]